MFFVLQYLWTNSKKKAEQKIYTYKQIIWTNGEIIFYLSFYYYNCFGPNKKSIGPNKHIHWGWIKIHLAKQACSLGPNKKSLGPNKHIHLDRTNSLGLDKHSLGLNTNSLRPNKNSLGANKYIHWSQSKIRSSLTNTCKQIVTRPEKYI